MKTDSGRTAFAGATEEPYITLINGPYTGYVVSIPWPEPGRPPLRRRFFGCKLSLQEYLDQAKRWRDRMYQVLHGKPVPVRAFHRQQANSTTGVPGVRRQVRRIRSRHDPTVVYEVAVYLAEVWLKPGKDGQPPSESRSRQFSIAKWGEDEAFRLACEWRQRAMSALVRGQTLDKAEPVRALARRRQNSGPER
jgi:hypothetical protein